MNKLQKFIVVLCQIYLDVSLLQSRNIHARTKLIDSSQVVITWEQNYFSRSQDKMVESVTQGEENWF